jgi:hypothetical protein
LKQSKIAELIEVKKVSASGDDPLVAKAVKRSQGVTAGDTIAVDPSPDTSPPAEASSGAR